MLFFLNSGNHENLQERAENVQVELIQNEHDETVEQNEMNEEDNDVENDLRNDVENRTNIVERDYAASVGSDMDTDLLNANAPVNTLSIPAEWCPNKTNSFLVCTYYCVERWTPEQHTGLDEALLGKKYNTSLIICHEIL